MGLHKCKDNDWGTFEGLPSTWFYLVIVPIVDFVTLLLVIILHGWCI